MQERVYCQYCRTTGKHEGKDCQACDGKGQALLRVPVATCHVCLGQGEKNGKRCRHCHGIGKVEVSSRK